MDTHTHTSNSSRDTIVFESSVPRLFVFGIPLITGSGIGMFKFFDSLAFLDRGVNIVYHAH